MTFFVLIPLGLIFALIGLAFQLLPIALLFLVGFFVVWAVVQSAGIWAAMALIFAGGALLGVYESWTERRRQAREARDPFAERLHRLSPDAKRAAKQLRYWDYYNLSRVRSEGSETQREAARLEIERREQRPASVPYHQRWEPERRWMEPRPWVKALIGDRD